MSPGTQGYWAVSASGAVFAYGDARIYGSVKHYAPAQPVAGIAATPGGRGYWILSGHGGVFSFGDAHYYGSLGKKRLPADVVAMTATPDGGGYWLVGADGRVYAFGDARSYGSFRPTYSQAGVKGIAATPSGHGYWLATASGHVYSFGDARYYGSMASSPDPLSAIAAVPGRQGYWLLAANGIVHGFGAAADLGGGLTVPGVTATALASSPEGAGYVLATTGQFEAKSLLGKPRTTVRDGRRRPASLVARAPALKLLGSFLVTCYDLTGVTASGEMAGPQSIAVDPSVIPLGTQIFVPGIGVRTADDTGGAIVGDHVDIWEPTYYACATWGAQVRPVYLVGP
jgi:3D (Asp-Asp-Asp) domain-containing protein